LHFSTVQKNKGLSKYYLKSESCFEFLNIEKNKKGKITREWFHNGKGLTQKGLNHQRVKNQKPDFDVRSIFAILNPVNRAVAYSTEL